MIALFPDNWGLHLMVERIGRRFYWPRIHEQVEEYIGKAQNVVEANNCGYEGQGAFRKHRSQRTTNFTITPSDAFGSRPIMVISFRHPLISGLVLCTMFVLNPCLFRHDLNLRDEKLERRNSNYYHIIDDSFKICTLYYQSSFVRFRRMYLKTKAGFHPARTPKTKSNKRGCLSLVIPGHDPPLDITIFLDVTKNPGPSVPPLCNIQIQESFNYAKFIIYIILFGRYNNNNNNNPGYPYIIASALVGPQHSPGHKLIIIYNTGIITSTTHDL